MNRVDLDLILLDFRLSHEQDKQHSLYELQSLLLDEKACRGRIAYLRELAARGESEFPELCRTAVRQDFSREIQLIGELGVIEAVRQGRIDPARLDALTWEPDALWQAHEALVGTEEVPAQVQGETCAEAAAMEATRPVGYTKLAQMQDWEQLRRRLRPYLPPMLERVGMDPGLADELLEFLVSRADDLGGRRFRDRLPEWLGDFAARHQFAAPARLTDADVQQIIGRSVVAITLENARARVSGPQPEWVGRFFDTARQAASVAELSTLDLPEEVAVEPAFPQFRRSVLRVARQTQEEAELLWELN
jgi:hypothetical protein